MVKFKYLLTFQKGMANKYQEMERLLAMSPVIEDAAYAVQYATGKEIVYAVGGSKCGSSSCASQSKCGNSRASSVSENRPLSASILEEKVK